jgi:hypothetical protein
MKKGGGLMGENLSLAHGSAEAEGLKVCTFVRVYVVSSVWFDRS